MADIKPFKIAVPDAQLDRLKQKLSLAEFPDEADFSDDWHYGVPLADIKRLAARWRDGFDWRKAEAELNQLPHFITSIPVSGHGDLQIHFVHQRGSREEGSIPLLFCHGWPGSYHEATKILPLLTNPSAPGQPSFHVVAPSLPNFGFSQRAARRGFGIPQYAEVCHNLMRKLGYERYVTQGGDWGTPVTRMLGLLYPKSVAASHLNFVRVESPPKFTKAPGSSIADKLVPHTAQEEEGLERTRWFAEEGFGYNLLQSTRPLTIGYALRDSPVALLAWVYEKLRDWTDRYPWTDDEVLTWVGIYAFSTAGPDAASQIYWENKHTAQELTARTKEWIGDVPLGLSYFPRDLIVPPSSWGRTLGPVVFERRHAAGGHFAAWERPEELVGDLREMFGAGGGAEGVGREFGAI
ncbi:uncharacterized protein E0L32_002112 [Thyridium curvatum]|uniref:Epoxide hydrolase N-terminal domain-containing protein n=1 Tax=Thyridium curvatum TaxID=1093900 RepID=A0A507ARI6_9PEZI|nr:uncharacterized protein E0L32_002021 [Thyridium curvatum]XP_030989220.1 uncharacterized protein E0L32_002112 [Thyridium curvatum]TPX07418.1 hypothetical protein E0L32_002021 [Thyridium curvatum]TPX07509.1 hypothetical protein E0L32_002112 [Thyridium curvatum]